MIILEQARWHITWPFKHYKQDGLIDQWRSTTTSRILCEVDGTLIALLCEHWFLIERW